MFLNLITILDFVKIDLLYYLPTQIISSEGEGDRNILGLDTAGSTTDNNAVPNSRNTSDDNFDPLIFESCLFPVNNA